MTDEKRRKGGGKPPQKRRYKKSKFHTLVRMNPRRWPARVRVPYVARIEELLSLEHIDPVRDKSLVVEIAFWEALASVLKHHIAMDGPLDEDGDLLDLVNEARLITGTLTKLWQIAGVAPFISQRMLAASDARTPDLTAFFSEIGTADVVGADGTAIRPGGPHRCVYEPSRDRLERFRRYTRQQTRQGR